MKKVLCVILVAVMAFSISACGRKTYIKGATEDEANYPFPEEEKIISSDTATGMSFDITLWDYTAAFNLMYSDLGGGDTQGISFDEWVVLEKDKTDERGTKFDYYYYKSDNFVLTASVESKTERLINIGCGTTMEIFTNDVSHQQEIMTLCGIMAAVSGGYSSDTVTFFDNLFVDTIDYEEHCFWYEKCVYTMSTSDQENEEETILFRVIPVSQEIKDKWNIQDYRKYWNK